MIVVHAEIETRVARLVELRGMAEADARARVAAQATEPQRRAVADVWLDNSGDQDDLVAQALQLWQQRIRPFADNLAAHRTVPSPTQLVPADPTWPDQGERILARLRTACGHRALRIDHIGSTAVPGLDAKDVIDVQVTVESLAMADELAESLLSAGYPRIAAITADNGKTDARSTVAEFDHAGDPALWQKRVHASADPGRATNVHIRVAGWPNQQFALLFPCWLAVDADARTEYLAVKREAERAGPAVASQRTPTPRRAGSTRPTGGRGRGPTTPDGARDAGQAMLLIKAPHSIAPLRGSLLSFQVVTKRSLFTATMSSTWISQCTLADDGQRSRITMPALLGSDSTALASNGAPKPSMSPLAV